MLRCQALSAARPGAGAAARPLRSCAARLQRCRVVVAAAPEGGSSQPPPSRRRTSGLEPQPLTAPEQLAGGSPRLEQQPLGGSNAHGATPHGTAHHSAAPGSSGASAAHKPAQAAAQPEPGSWEDWQRHFYEVDDIVSVLVLLLPFPQLLRYLVCLPPRRGTAALAPCAPPAALPAKCSRLPQCPAMRCAPAALPGKCTCLPACQAAGCLLACLSNADAACLPAPCRR